MATVEDIAVSAFINILTAFAFLLAFALLRIQPINDRVYYSKWYISGGRKNTRRGGNVVGKYVNLNWRTYFTFLNWIPGALAMSQNELVKHAGMDSVIYLRIFVLGLKIFAPWTLLSIIVLIPVNLSGDILHNLTNAKDVVSDNIDSLSISNVGAGSHRLWVHIAMAYFLTLWTCFMLYKEYDTIAFKRLHFLASQDRRADQFTVLVRNIPHVSGHSISQSVEHFFQKNHPEHYLGHQDEPSAATLHVPLPDSRAACHRSPPHAASASTCGKLSPPFDLARVIRRHPPHHLKRGTRGINQ